MYTVLSDSERQKQDMWKMHDRIVALKTTRDVIGLSEQEYLELRNLEVKFMQVWSDLKDGL